MTQNDSYKKTRHNSLRWGIAVEGPMPCLGDRCKYREGCDLPGPELPHIGESCPLETAYARRIEHEFRRDYGHLADAGCLEGFDDLIDEAKNILLARARVTTRSNRAWELGSGEGASLLAVESELALTDRYYEALANRWMAVLERIRYATNDYARKNARPKAYAFGLIDAIPREEVIG